MAFLLSKKNKSVSRAERYKGYRSFTDDMRVIELIDGFEIGSGSIVKRMPFIILKKKLFGLLFFAATMLHVIGYEFKR